MHITHAKITVILSCLATITYMYILWRRKFKKQRISKLPTKWRQVGQIQKLIIYPLKSGGYLDLRKAKCGVRGLEEDSQSSKLPLRDRIFVVFNEETGVNVTAKSNPPILLVKVNAETTDVVSFSHPSEVKLYVTIPQSDSEKRTSLYRQLNDPKEIEVEGLCPKFGIYIGLHLGGSVAVGDPVYVNIE